MRAGIGSVFLLLAATLFAQTEKQFHLSWISLTAGASVNSNFRADTTLYQQLTSGNNSLLHPQLNGYKHVRPFTSYNPGFDLSAAVGFRISGAEKSRGERFVRIAGHLNGNQFVNSLFRYEEFVRYDTITIQGETIFRDTMYRYEYAYRFYQLNSGVEIACLLSTDTSKLIGFYGGVSLTQLFSVLSYVHAENRTQYKLTETNSSETTDVTENETLDRNSVFLKGRTSLTTRIGIPAAVTFRFSKSLPLVKKIYFTFEICPYFEFASVRTVNNFRNAGAVWSGGVRYKFAR